MNWNKIWNSNWVQYGGTLVVILMVLFGLIYVFDHAAERAKLETIIIDVISQSGVEYALIVDTTCPDILRPTARKAYATWTEDVNESNDLNLVSHFSVEAMIKDFVRLQNLTCYVGHISPYPKVKVIQFEAGG